MSRTFKTAWFARAARKASIADSELCRAIRQFGSGQSTDLGGGVFKKRLNDNRYRAIILARSNAFRVFAFLFAKKDRANISDDELQAFRKLADIYREKSAQDIEAELASGALQEICHEDI